MCRAILRVCVLHLEQMGRNIKNAQFGVQLFDFRTDGVDKVSLSYTRCSVNEQGVESSSGEHCHALGCCAREFIAATLDVVVEGVFADEHGIELLYCLGFLGCASVGRNGVNFGLNLHIAFAGLVAGRVGDYGVCESHALADYSCKSAAKKVNVVLLEEFIDKMALNFDVKSIVLEFERNNIREPSGEYICRYIVTYNAQTIIPYCV